MCYDTTNVVRAGRLIGGKTKEIAPNIQKIDGEGVFKRLLQGISYHWTAKTLLRFVVLI